MQNQIEPAEVVAVLRSVISGESDFEFSPGYYWADEKTVIHKFVTRGYTITIFVDAGELDYVEAVVAPDGRQADDDYFSCDESEGDEPISQLTEAECQALIARFAAKQKRGTAIFKIRRAAVFTLVAVVAFLACIRLSSIAGPVLFSAIDSLFPAVSGVTNNTATVRGLTPTTYNLSFLWYSALTAIFLAAAAVLPKVLSRQPLLIASLGFLVLTLVSSINFWPREQLIQLWVQGVICFACFGLGVSQYWWLKHRVTHGLPALLLALAIGLTVFSAVLLPLIFGTIAFLLQAGWSLPLFEAEFELELMSTMFAAILAVTVSVGSFPGSKKVNE